MPLFDPALTSEVLRRFPAAKFNEPLSRHSTFKIGGPADCYIELMTRADVADFMALVSKTGQNIFCLGWGSKLLVRDGGIRGIVIRLRGDFEKLEFPGDERVLSGAAVRIPQLVALCGDKGLSGAEPLIGIPGTVGGALVMNAGTRDGEIGDLVLEISGFDPQDLCEKVLTRDHLHFTYRASNLSGLIIFDTLLQLKAGSKGDIMALVAKYQQKRLKTQPVHTYNVGSIFKNPPGRFVAQMIEELGLKGAVCGGARVSPLHANFIENFSGATARDVLTLVKRIREAVQISSGIELELEMKVVGED